MFLFGNYVNKDFGLFSYLVNQIKTEMKWMDFNQNWIVTKFPPFIKDFLSHYFRFDCISSNSLSPSPHSLSYNADNIIIWIACILCCKMKIIIIRKEENHLAWVQLFLHYRKDEEQRLDMLLHFNVIILESLRANTATIKLTKFKRISFDLISREYIFESNGNGDAGFIRDVHNNFGRQKM